MLYHLLYALHGQFSLQAPRLPAPLHLLIALLKAHDAAALQQALGQWLMRQGLHQFALDTLGPLNRAVGVAWMRGEIEVFEEHLYTEQVQATLRAGISAFPRQAGHPRVLLTTLPGEHHGLGLLMVEAVLVCEAAQCISLGIQSFNPRHLQALGRIHDDTEARRAAELAAIYFDTFNLDLMYALPGQSLDEALADIETALDFQPPHLSAYHLTLEPNTPFGHTAPPNLPDDDLAADMQQAIEARLAEAGMQHYETSAYARPHHACRHNLNYWQFGDYLGIGAGAHSKLSFHDRIVRQMRTKHPQQYMDAVKQGAHIADTRTLTHDDLPFEFMMNALRLNAGVPAALFEERTGLPLIVCAPALEQARARGLLEAERLRLKPTVQGQRFLNDLLELFLAA